jgi:hypothetical protein
MISQRDIFATAQLLIKKHGSKAEAFADKMMLRLMNKNDVKGASVWLSVSFAIDDLQKCKQQQGKLH